jgi:hypothetical protein
VDTLMAISLISRGNAPAASTTISPGVRGLLAVCGADGGAADGGRHRALRSLSNPPDMVALDEGTGWRRVRAAW